MRDRGRRCGGRLCIVSRAAIWLAASGALGVHAAPLMIVGDDEKVSWDAQGNTVLTPTGKDNVLIVDVADPEAPRIVAKLPIENSVVGPPVNVDIDPSGAIALVANSVTVIQAGDNLKSVPTDKLFVIDLKANPPKLAQTLQLGKQPSGLSINTKGDLALVANRGDNSISVLKIAGTQVKKTDTVSMKSSVSTVEFTPDGKRAVSVRSTANMLAFLDISGDSVTTAHDDIPTYLFPYNVVVTPNGQLALTADNGDGGNSDGNVDVVSVIDAEAKPPRAIDRIAVADAPEGLAVSPKGDLAVVASVRGSNKKGSWFYHPNGLVTILGIEGKQVRKLKEIEVGSTPEAVAFTPDGQYIYVGNYLDADFSILRVNGTDVTDTGKRFKVPGHPASARMGPP